MTNEGSKERRVEGRIIKRVVFLLDPAGCQRIVILQACQLSVL